jgi:ABC-type transport system substrate-binding protein
MRTRSFPVRRSLLVVVALALAAVVGITLPASAGASRRAVLPKPGQGGKLVFAGYLPSLWDPALSTAGTDISALSLVYSGLTKLDVHGNPVPDIASGWKWSKNGLSITFTLRPHLVYSDGAPLDAKSVKTNILRGRDDPKSLIAPQLTPVKAVHTPNATTVTLVLNQLDWDLPRILAGKTGELVSPKAIASNPAGLATQPVGAGPFKLTNLVSGSSATLVRNPTYWDAIEVIVYEV